MDFSYSFAVEIVLVDKAKNKCKSNDKNCSSEIQDCSGF